jgi:hypothetical protein
MILHTAIICSETLQGCPEVKAFQWVKSVAENVDDVRIGVRIADATSAAARVASGR